MYVQLTTRCNMLCEHCCYSCGPKGKDITRETFVKTCKLAEEYSEAVFLGGGEPTLHPFFWDFLGLALGYNNGESKVGVITNGKRDVDAIKIARLAQAGVIYGAVSQDDYHEPINPAVIKAFTKDHCYGDLRNDYRDIRIANKVLKAGRAKSWGDVDDCCCDEIVIDPMGNIFGCGCKKTKYGTLDNPQIPDGIEWGECAEKK